MPGWLLFFLGTGVGAIATCLIMTRPTRRMYKDATKMFHKAEDMFRRSLSMCKDARREADLFMKDSAGKDT